MFRLLALLFILHSSFFALHPLKAQSTTDVIYDPKIQTVLLYPQIGDQAENPSLSLNPAVVSQDEGTGLELTFDDLQGQYRPFRARLIHCNADWQRSVLNDIEFTYEYNDYAITDYQVSVNTKVPYYHYRFALPKVKLPGNYVLVVYDERDRNNVYFTRRFCIYTNRVSALATVTFSSIPNRQFYDQQINLALTYRGYPVNSPQDDFKVIIRQNFRDDRILTNLLPTNVRAFDGILEYNILDQSNTISGGNEFRFFDTRNTISRGNFIDRIDRNADRNVAFVQPDQPRSGSVYFQSDDFNGLYAIDQRDNQNGPLSADYVETVFTLRAPELPEGEVYVTGAFNLWLLNNRNQMVYEPSLGAYRARILLKQGVYNYAYAIRQSRPKPAVSESVVEGDYSATENEYEVFVYNRPPASRADQLVGYTRVGTNRRK